MKTDYLQIQPFKMKREGSSRVLTNTKKSHALIQLLSERDPDGWRNGLIVFKYFVQFSLEEITGLQVTQSQLMKARREIQQLIADFPPEYQEAYQYFLDRLADPTEYDGINPPRLIEWLGIVGTKFVLDSIREQKPQLQEIGIQGITEYLHLRNRSPKYRIWIMHDLGSDIDLLLTEMMDLAKERVVTLIEDRPMDWQAILARKVYKFSPTKRSRHTNWFRRVVRRLSNIAKEGAGAFLSCVTHVT